MTLTRYLSCHARAWFQGIALQIMDVSDPDAPSLTHKEVIGTRGDYTPAGFRRTRRSG